MHSQRIRNLAQALYGVVFDMLEDEPEIDGAEAGRVATLVEATFRDALANTAGPLDAGRLDVLAKRMNAEAWAALDVEPLSSEDVGRVADAVERTFRAMLGGPPPSEAGRVVLYTTAPAAYDGFSTREIASDAGTDHRGYVVREVSLEPRDLDWQTNRYASGLHAYATAATAAKFPALWQIRDQGPEPARCEHCGGAKVPGDPCHGEDVCEYGPDGGKAQPCEGWGRYCCRCGAAFARNQM